jgi:hypothetical protein
MAPFHVDQSKRSATSIESDDKIGAWDVTDIEAFKPERWLVQNEKGETELTYRAGPENAFGAGPRG